MSNLEISSSNSTINSSTFVSLNRLRVLLSHTSGIKKIIQTKEGDISTLWIYIVLKILVQSDNLSQEVEAKIRAEGTEKEMGLTLEEVNSTLENQKLQFLLQQVERVILKNYDYIGNYHGTPSGITQSLSNIIAPAVNKRDANREVFLMLKNVIGATLTNELTSEEIISYTKIVEVKLDDEKSIYWNVDIKFKTFGEYLLTMEYSPMEAQPLADKDEGKFLLKSKIILKYYLDLDIHSVIQKNKIIEVTPSGFKVTGRLCNNPFNVQSALKFFLESPHRENLINFIGASFIKKEKELYIDDYRSMIGNTALNWEMDRQRRHIWGSKKCNNMDFNYIILPIDTNRYLLLGSIYPHDEEHKQAILDVDCSKYYGESAKEMINKPEFSMYMLDFQETRTDHPPFAREIDNNFTKQDLVNYFNSIDSEIVTKINSNKGTNLYEFYTELRKEHPIIVEVEKIQEGEVTEVYICLDIVNIGFTTPVRARLKVGRTCTDRKTEYVLVGLYPNVTNKEDYYYCSQVKKIKFYKTKEELYSLAISIEDYVRKCLEDLRKNREVIVNLSKTINATLNMEYTSKESFTYTKIIDIPTGDTWKDSTWKVDTTLCLPDRSISVEYTHLNTGKSITPSELVYSKLLLINYIKYGYHSFMNISKEIFYSKDKITVLGNICNSTLNLRNAWEFFTNIPHNEVYLSKKSDQNQAKLQELGLGGNDTHNRGGSFIDSPLDPNCIHKWYKYTTKNFNFVYTILFLRPDADHWIFATMEPTTPKAQKDIAHIRTRDYFWDTMKRYLKELGEDTHGLVIPEENGEIPVYAGFQGVIKNFQKIIDQFELIDREIMGNIDYYIDRERIKNIPTNPN